MIPSGRRRAYAVFMAYIESHARDQGLLLPASVEDYVAAHSPVRFIDAFVDDLDLGEAGFHRTRPKATGRPVCDPADMLKLALYGYLNRVRSSRRLEAMLELASAVVV